MDCTESACPFDTSAYTGTPDSAPTENSMDVPGLIEELDGLFEKGREKEAGAFLEARLSQSRDMGDWRAELAILSELMGYYRRSMERDKGLTAVEEGLRLIEEHSLGRSVSGATVVLNAATTLKCFGENRRARPLYTHVCRVYSDKLSPEDYRFAGLYNNMALNMADMGEYAAAEKYYGAALKILEKTGENLNERADTLCNMAEMYAKIEPDDSRIEQCLEKAWEYLNSPELPRDGYHAFNASKCIPVFDYFGYFLYAKELRERVREIYERP